MAKLVQNRPIGFLTSDVVCLQLVFKHPTYWSLVNMRRIKVSGVIKTWKLKTIKY